MTSGKAALLTAGLVGVVALGVVTAPTIRNHWSKMNTETTTTASAPADTSAPAPVKAKRPAHRAASREAVTAKEAVTARRTPAGSTLSPSRCGSPNCAIASRRF